MILKGYLLIIAAAALWGLIGPISKYAFSEGLAPLEVAFWRAALAWIFFSVHAVIKGNTGVEKRDIPALFVFGITGVTCFYGSYQLAVDNGGAALSAVLLYTAPAWVAVMSRIFFKESMTKTKLLALFFTLSGVTAVSIGPGGFNYNVPAIIFGLVSGFCYALYYIFGKHFSERYTSPNIFLYILPLGAITLFPFVDFTPKTPRAWTALFLLAFLSTYGAYYLYYLGLKHLEATRAAITATLEPVMAGIIAYFWWNEYFSPTGYVGSGLILMSVLIMVWDGTRIRNNVKKG